MAFQKATRSSEPKAVAWLGNDALCVEAWK